MQSMMATMQLRGQSAEATPSQDPASASAASGTGQPLEVAESDQPSGQQGTAAPSVPPLALQQYEYPAYQHPTVQAEVPIETDAPQWVVRYSRHTGLPYLLDMRTLRTRSTLPEPNSGAP